MNRKPFIAFIVLMLILSGVAAASAQETEPFVFETGSIIDLEIVPKEGSASDFTFLVRTRDDCPEAGESDASATATPVPAARVLKNGLTSFEFTFPDLNLTADPLVMKSVRIVPERVVWRSIAGGGEYEPWEAAFDPVIEYYFLTDPRRLIDDDEEIFPTVPQSEPHTVIPSRKTLELFTYGITVGVPLENETERWDGSGWVAVDPEKERLLVELIHRGEAVGSESYEVGLFTQKYYDGHWVGSGGSSPHVESLKAKSYRPVAVYQYEDAPELKEDNNLESRFEQTWVRPTFRITYLTTGDREIVREVTFDHDWIFRFGTPIWYFGLEPYCLSVTAK